MAIVTVGIDLAKNVFAVHGVDETGKPVLVRPEVQKIKENKREKIKGHPLCFAACTTCLIRVPRKAARCLEPD